MTWRIRKGTPALAAVERSLVVAALTHFHIERYQLYAYVVMDDHVHTVLRPVAGYTLSSIVQSLKSYTTRQLWQVSGRQGAVWQKDYFDRIIRSESDLLEKMQYVLDNPFKRWPDMNEYEWVRAFTLDNVEA